MSRTAIAAASAFTLVVGPLLAGPILADPVLASAHGAVQKAGPKADRVTKGLVGPLSVAQAPDGTRYWSDNFAGPLWKQSPGAEPRVVFKSRSAAAEAVSADQGVLRFTTGSSDNSKGNLWTLDTSGRAVKVANIGRYEKAVNPDGKITYGFLNTSKSCLAQVPREAGGSYTGVKETHPYGTAYAAGVTYVADAGANAIFAISATGAISTVAVIKPVRVRLSEGAVEALGLPSCTVGRRYALESVPTDVEVGPDGLLYVTSLPGGPEDGSLGANGRVLRVDPVTGKVTTIVGGLLAPTGVAVDAAGTVYVAELFKGVISKIRAGSSKVRTYARLPLPAAVEITPTGLLVTIDSVPGQKPKGKVITLTW